MERGTLLVDVDNADIVASPNANGHWITREKQYVHRVVAERVLGRPLVGRQCVHHVNENKADNRRANLVVCPDDAYHSLLHARARIVDAGGIPGEHKICSECDELKPRAEFPQHKRKLYGIHNECKLCTNGRRKKAKYNYWGDRAREQQRARRAKRKQEAMCA